MATKEDQLSSFCTDRSYSDKSSQFLNLNLNKNHKCDNAVQSFSKSNKDLSFGLTVTDNYQEKRKSWNKASTDLCLKTSKNPSLNFKSEDKKGNKKSWMNDKLDKSPSTLSLHIAAYENSEKSLNETDGSLFNKSRAFKSLDSLSDFQEHQDAFEYPRQNNDLYDWPPLPPPQVMQYRASQRLFSPNQGVPFSHIRRVSLREIKFAKNSMHLAGQTCR